MRSCTFAIALWLGACHTGATTSSTTTETRAHAQASDRIHAPLVLQSTSKPAAKVRAEPASALPDRPMRLVYALASELPRAELRRGASWLADFGAPSDAQYTLGGWQTSAGDSITLGAASAMLVRGKTLKLFIPAESTSAQRLALRVRSFARTSLLLYVGGKKLADAALGGDELEDIELSLPRGALKVGDNLIELRVGRTGSARGVAKGVSRAGFALDHIALSDAAAAATPTRALAPPSPGELCPAADTLQIPRDVRLSYTLEVPAGAELRATVRGGAAGTRLRVSAQRDGARALELGSVEIGPGERALKLSLAALAGDLARLELAAIGGQVTLSMPVVVEPGEASGAAQKPIKNVVLMLIDTLRADKLKNYNPKSRVRTPGLARFLENAVTMHDARTQENWTKPSVATLLSSLFPWQHNAFTGDAKVPASVQLLPEYFQDRGFVTAAFIANGYVSDKFGFGQGWSDYRNYIREGRRSIGQEVAGDVLSWLDTRPKDKPFFLYVHTIDPHVPYRPPASFLAMYDPAPYSGPVNFSRSAELLEQIKLGKLPLNDRDKVRLQALYDGEISYHDVHFAAIIDGLAKRGLADDTMVVITADHGEEFWDHGSVGHGHSVFDELLRIPMIVRIPGLTEGNATVRGDVGLVDVAPTILEALKLPVPDGMYGRSFLPEISGQRSGAPRGTASGFMTSFRTLASGRYKLVQRGVDNATLYDLRADPGETRDVAAAKPIALRHTRGLLGLTLASSGSEATTERKVHKQEKTKIDAATEAQLRALGYVGTSRP